jgi:hypothetical protein
VKIRLPHPHGKRVRALFWVPLLSVWFGTPAAAQSPDCLPSGTPPLRAGSTSLTDLSARLADGPTEWWAADEDQIEDAPCALAVPSNREFEGFNNRWSQETLEPQRSETIHGIHFENESPRLLEAFRAMTLARNEFGEPDPARQQTLSSSCKNVRCALNELLGRDNASRTLYLYARYGANASPIGVPGTKPFRTSELNDVIRGLSDFPASLLPRNESFQINRMDSSSGSVVANAVMMLFNRWGSEDDELRRSVIFHEFAHRMAGEQDLDESPEWLRASGWTLRPGFPAGGNPSFLRDYTLSRPEAPTSRYGATNPAEDFAESAVAYRYNPRELLRRSPEKYRFLKETVFQGLEYVNAGACHPARSYGARVDAELLQRTIPPLPASLHPRVTKECAGPLLRALPAAGALPPQTSEEVRSCLGDRLIATIRQQIFDERIAGSLTYAATARGAFERTSSLGPDSPVPPSHRRDLAQAAVSQARTVLRNTLTTAIFEESRMNFRASYTPDTPAPQFCQNLTRYAYQWIDSVPGGALTDPSSSLTTYRAREPVEAFFHSVCIRLQGTGPTRRTVTREEVEAEVRARIPD